jgi:hypothetical protein
MVFNNSNINKVLDKFIDLILENKLNLLDRKKYKVIGWVGKEKEAKRTIPSYYRDYNRIVQVKKMDFHNLENYLKENKSVSAKNDEAGYYRSNILRAMLKLLRLAEVKDENSKHFSERSFLKNLRDNHDEFYELLMKQMAKWCLDLGNHNDIFDEIRIFLLTDFRAVFEFDITENDIAVFFDRIGDETDNQEKMDGNNDNTYTYRDITVELTTVHSAKGETHSATLYLETFYYKYDIQRIIKYLKGIYEEPNSLELEALKVAFVGMSRPTHLLCIAAHETTILPHKRELEQNGWEVISV